MNRKLKALGLALFAAFAISAVAASGASAESDADFNAGEGAVQIDATGEGNQVFFTPGVGTFTCVEEEEESSMHGIADYEGESSTITAQEGELTNCHATFLQFPVTVDMNTCHLLFHAGTMTGTDTAEGDVAIDCTEEGDKITVTVLTDDAHESLGCTLYLPEQTVGPVTYENIEVEGTQAVTGSANIADSLKKKYEGPLCGEGETEEADMQGALIAQATDESEEYVDFEVTGTE